jgi:carbamoyltransferase
MTYNIALTTSHNATVVISKSNTIIDVIELERVLGVKNCGFSDADGTKLEQIQAVLAASTNNKSLPLDTLAMQIHEHKSGVFRTGAYRLLGNAKTISEYPHHYSHASGTFYQSAFDKAIVISADGGGNDGVFSAFLFERHEEPQLIYKKDANLGVRYSSFGNICGSIKKETTKWEANLIYPGKMMGLAGFGRVNQRWLPAFKQYFMSSRSDKSAVDLLYAATNINIHDPTRFKGEVEESIAATAQKAFELALIDMIIPAANEYPELPICLTGGCALNIIANTKIEQYFQREIFVAPNSSDCGLAVGMVADLLRPAEPIDITYAGVDILDKDTFDHSQYNFQPWDIEKIGGLIVNGSILGVMRGKSEHGPRALGNRSIICYPAFPDMKMILNRKIKNREWYRPFAPVVRLEDVGKYFERDKESRWMNFITFVRPKYREIIPAITHVDGSARVQTVTRDQNAFLYDLLTYIDHKTGIGVLLNTSLNVDGQPIASKIEHAMTVYNQTKIDGMIINDKMVLKNG